MLANALVCANVAVTDLERARRFYGDGLGLTEADIGDPDEVFFRAGGGTMLHLYQRPSTAPEQRVAMLLVEDLVKEMSLLRGWGIRFVDYDLGGLKTQDGLFRDERGFKAAWVKDPDGNILSLEQPAGGLQA